MINTQERGECSTHSCTNRGFRARGAADIEPTAARTGVFRKTFYCDGCLTAAAQRSLGTSLRLTAPKPRAMGQFQRPR